MSGMSDREREIRLKLRNDLPHYAERCLKIRPKDPTAGNIPFRLNKAQLYLHSRLEQQKAETGKVRALVLKGRQQGISTYIGGRFYHRVTHSNGTRCFILTHEQDATDNLFGMVERYHDHCPALVKPATGAANAKELYFRKLESGYAVGTAGTKAVGRSQTIQLFHGCLSPETPILDGRTGDLRPMNGFAIGDLVRTHTGAVAPVSFVSRQVKQARTVKLKGLRSLPLIATAEHRFWTRSGWRALGDLAPGDRIGFPVAVITEDRIQWPYRLETRSRPQGGGTQEVGPDTVRPDYALGRVLGLYLAEGCLSRQTSGVLASVQFTVHEREVARTVAWLKPLAGLFRSEPKVSPRANCKTVVISVYGRSFASFVEARCGELDGKRVPDEWRYCGPDFARGIAHGYLAGDGHSSKRPGDRRISAPSIRPAITTGIRDILASLGYGWASVVYREGAVRHGRNERAQWTLRLCGAGVDRLCAELGWQMPERKRNGAYGDIEVSDGYAWLPIVSIEDAGEVPVMDFEVAHPDHSYCTVHGATHNSEVGFWPNATTHFAGVVQAVPDLPGTEIVLESTANGMGGEFHQRWQQAERGEGDYIAVFIPWYWQTEYRRPAPAHFSLDEEEAEYMQAYELSLEQMAWRRFKIIELKDPTLFKQEYPATAAEAFQMTGHDSYIPAELVLRARKAKRDGLGPLVIGYDPAWKGSDRHAMAWRRGRKVFQVQTRDKLDTMGGAGWAKQVLDVARPARMFVDVGGVGAGVYDRLVEMGYGEVVRAVNFGSSPLEPSPQDEQGRPKGGYANRRAEMWGKSREWLEMPGGVDLPDKDTIQADACAPGYRYDSLSRLILESKDDIRKRGLPSPDEWDAIALTFAEPVADKMTHTHDGLATVISDARAGY